MATFIDEQGFERIRKKIAWRSRHPVLRVVKPRLMEAILVLAAWYFDCGSLLILSALGAGVGLARAGHELKAPESPERQRFLNRRLAMLLYNIALCVVAWCLGCSLLALHFAFLFGAALFSDVVVAERIRSMEREYGLG